MAIFDRAIELGVTFWDTANRYNNASGNSERLIGKWLKANPDQRRNVIIATKIFGGMDGFTPNHCRLSRGHILDAVHASLARLQVDHIDLLYFHTYELCTPVEESLAAVEDLVRRDLVRYFGVGNLSVDQLRLYQAAGAALSVRCRVVAVQNGFDILHGETNPEHRGVLGHCDRSGVSYVAYSPLARGLLTERYLDLARAGPGDRLYDEGTLEKDTSGPVMDKLHRLAALARQWDLDLSQVALAYTLALPGMGPVIPGASSVGQLESNAQAAYIQLTDEQRRQIEAIVGQR
jgi:aryl-alcohol dehydrogenase-like predicted oxidoreductase